MRPKQLKWERDIDGNQSAYIEVLDWFYVVGASENGFWWGMRGHGVEVSGFNDEASAMAAAQMDFDEIVNELLENG